MAENNGTNDGKVVRCDHCTENLAGVCGHCGGDHHGPDCPTLRGVLPFTADEVVGILERLSVTPDVVDENGAPDSGELIAQMVKDYRAIQADLTGPASVSKWHLNDDGAALTMLQILYGSERSS